MPICSGAPGIKDGQRRIELETTAGENNSNMKDSYLGNDAGLELREGRARILAAPPGDICRGSHLTPHLPLPLGCTRERTTAPGAVPGIIC